MKKIFLFCALLLNIIYGQSGGSDKIVFMKFKMTSNGITFSGYQLAEGKYTAVSFSTGEINYEIINNYGSIINIGHINNPLLVRYEYEDPNNNGQLKSITIKKDYAVFFIRVPYNINISKINFYNYEQEKNTIQLNKENSVYLKKLISSVELPEFNK